MKRHEILFFVFAVMILSSVFSFPVSAQATNRYVRQGAVGTGSGADWTNAYTNLPAALVRGDVYYVADGSYGSYIFDDTNSGTATITLKKAVEEEHGIDTGWISTYGDGQAVFSGWQVYTDYYVFNGQVRNSDWRSGGINQYGITTGNTRIDNGGGIGGDNLVFQYIDIHGGGRDTGQGDDVIYGLTSNSNITFQYCALRDSDRTIFLTRGTPQNWVVDHSYIARNASSAAIHGEIMSSTSSDNITFSNNVIEDPEGTAIWAFINGGTASDWKIYGNTIFHSSSYGREGISGVLFCANDASNNNICNNFRIYNNTIWGIEGLWSGFVFQAGTGNIVQNNIWYNSVTTNNSGASFDYNWYYNTGANGDTGANKQTCTSNCNIFFDAVNRDFRLTSATNSGITLPFPYSIDPDNNSRGGDGTWDRGAFEYGTSTPDTESPTSPTNLAATSPSQSSISVSWNPATDNVGVTGYIVERCQGSGCSNFAQVGTPTASPFTDSGLTANTFYNYHVRATDAAGNLSGWSNVVGTNTQLPDTQPPTVPTNLSASVVSSSAINLTWTASTDTVGVTGYKVERCSGASCTNFAQVGTPTATSYSDTGLSATTLYRYRVRATDAAGNNSNYSNIASATTPQAPPTPTFVSEYETAWNSATSPKTTANFSVQTGDILVASAVNEDAGNTIATPPTGTLSGTWALKQTISTASYTSVRLWTLSVTTNQSNVNVSFSNSSGNFGGSVLHFRNGSTVGVTQQATGATGNPTLTLNGVEENSSIVMVNGDWTAKTGARTYNTTQAGSFTETTAYADGTSYGVEAGYYPNAGTAGNKTIGLTAPTGMKWALAAIEVKGNPTQTGPQLCNTVTTANFSQAAYNSYGAPYDAFQTSTNLMNTTCTSADTHTINLTTGVTGDTTRIVYTKGYWYDAVTTAWRQYTGTCTGALNGEWCQGSVSATITDPNVSTASAGAPTYLVGMTCSVQGGNWKCGCRDTSCTNFSWQIQGAGM